MQPDRAWALVGFDGRGAGASIHNATATGAKCSGLFVDTADFAVLMFHNADDVYNHLRIRHLPRFDLAGHTLTFDITATNVQTIDSPAFATIPWASISFARDTPIPENATLGLFEYASLVSGAWTAASATFEVIDGGLLGFDWVRLGYINVVWEVFADSGDSAADVAEALADQVNATDWTAIGPSWAIRAIRTGASIKCEAARWGKVNITGHLVEWVSGSKFQGLRPGETLTIGGAHLAIDTVESSTRLRLVDSLDGTGLGYTAPRGGVDSHAITLWQQAKEPARLKLSPGDQRLAGGTADATWRVSLDFSALGLTAMRQMWFTFAPQLKHSGEYVAEEWSVTFSNWAFSGPNPLLSYPDPAKGVLVGSDDYWARPTSQWVRELGFYWHGQAIGARVADASVSVRYVCQFEHDLYVGTSLYSDRGALGVKLDGDAETTLNCYLAAEPPVNNRRLVRSGVPAGEHTAVLRCMGSAPVYFDYLEAVVSTHDVAEPERELQMCPANDYGTDHTYKLPPERTQWALEKLGFVGDQNVYVSVFWWNNLRKRVNFSLATARVSFVGGFSAGDQVFLNLSGLLVGKSVFAGDTVAVIATHLAYSLNATAVGVWAEVDGDEIVVHNRAATAAYSFTLSGSVPVGTATVVVTGALDDGVDGQWEVDPLAPVAINRGAREWISAWAREAAVRGRKVAFAYSMELTTPPQDVPGDGRYYLSRFPGGQPVLTATSFGSLFSGHCGFTEAMLAFHKQVYAETAALIEAEGLPVLLQVGEFLWWFFSNRTVPDLFGTGPWTGDSNEGMGFYDEDVKAKALAALGRPLHIFRTPDDDPTINGGVDAQLLRDILHSYIERLRAHVVALYPDAKFEILLPLDVSFPRQYGRYNLGGRLNNFVSVPATFLSPDTAPFDYVKMEGLDFGSGTRWLDGGNECRRYPFTAGAWPKAKCRYLIPCFNGGTIWERELQQTLWDGVAVNFWAWDHVCYFGWEMWKPLPRSEAINS